MAFPRALSALRGWRVFELAALSAGSIAISALVFLPDSGLPLKFLMLPAVLWGALRFGPWVSSAVVLVTSVFAVVGLVRQPLNGSEHGGPALLLGFLVTLALVNLLLNAWLAERARSQQVLRRNEERLRLALSQADMGTFEADLAEGRVVWDAHHRELYGVSGAQFSGDIDDYFAFVHSEDVAMLRAAWDSAARGAGRYHADFRIVRPDGEVRWMSTSGAALGNPVRMIGVVHDLSERKRAELERRSLETQLWAAQKVEAIGTLAGGIAHDFNNILAGILGNTEMAEAALPQHHVAGEYLSDVRAAAFRARELVAQILTFSRQERGDPGARVVVDLQQVTDEAVRLLRASLPATIEIRFEPSDEPCCVLADATQIHQVVMNLGSNAAHAMSEHGGHLEIAASLMQVDVGSRPPHRDLSVGRYVLLSVRDTGLGMTPATLARIFEPFFSTRPPGQGTGLGLSVVHGIVRDHSGLVQIESVLGVGTTVRVYLPAVDPEVRQSSGRVPLPQLSKRPHVLLVDDEPIIVRTAHRMLERAGYRVSHFTDPQAALVAFRAADSTFDLVITDLTMPGLTGLGLAAHLLELQPKLPIVLSTGYCAGLDEQKLREQGIRGLLRKPYSMQELTAILKRVSAARIDAGS